jgi:pyridoxal phosphate enzyme (YggS family)
VKTKVRTIKERIKTAAVTCGRDPGSIRLVAVSKTKPAHLVKEAMDSGIETFGENYIQEARKKILDLSAYPASWHFIGHLQTNKAKYAVKLFDLIHTVDSVKLALELNQQAKKIDKIQDILVQVNTGMETSKSGVSPDDTMALVRQLSAFDHIRIRGLMTIPPLYNEPDRVAPYFRMLRELRDRVSGENIPHVNMDELSMGMTGDFETAISEGATLVRIGTAIFGQRQ